MIGQCTIHVVYLYVYINLCLYWSIVNLIIVCAIQNVYAYNFTLHLPQCICFSCFIDRVNHQSCPVQGTWPVVFHPIFGGMKIYGCHARWSTIKNYHVKKGPSTKNLFYFFRNSSYMFLRFPTFLCFFHVSDFGFRWTWLPPGRSCAAFWTICSICQVAMWEVCALTVRFMNP